MSWITNLFAPQPQKVLVSPPFSELRPGMWVMTKEGIGILHKFISEVAAEVHLVNETDGTTKMQLAYILSDLRQALYKEIPKVRRGFSLKTASRLGYK